MRHVVILAGGRGERFWPRSRQSRPKHLIPIVGDQPMLAQTVERVGDLVPLSRVIVVTAADQVAGVLEACPWLSPSQVVGEPVGRDTGPAVALAAALVEARAPGASFALLPADHLVRDTAGFRATLRAAFEAAESAEVLVTVGIRPDHPATGYGYLKLGGETGTAGGVPVYRVDRFVEKPDEARARAYLASGDHLWNAGMFAWRTTVLAEALAKHAPTLRAAYERMLAAARAAAGDPAALSVALAADYPGFAKISIDYALMEKAEHVRVVAAAFDWDDVGAWPAVARHLDPDASGNRVQGSAKIVDGTGNLAVSTGGRTIALLGVNDLIVVETPDAILVCPRDRAQDIKKLVQALAADPATRGLV